MPSTLRAVNVQEDALAIMAEKTVQYGTVGKLKKLSKEDVLAILKKAY